MVFLRFLCFDIRTISFIFVNPTEADINLNLPVSLFPFPASALRPRPRPLYLRGLSQLFQSNFIRKPEKQCAYTKTNDKK